MKLIYIIALILVIFVDWFLITFLSFEGRNELLTIFLYSLGKFLCYLIPLLIFSRKVKVLGIQQLFTAAIIGLLLHIIFYSISVIYSDWRYISNHPEDLFSRNFRLVIIPETIDTMMLSAAFLILALLLGFFYNLIKNTKAEFK